MKRTAVIYGDGMYRGVLKHVWDDSRPLLVVGMLNPSDADAERDDPTMLALDWFGKAWRYGGLWIVNEYAFRSPSPAAMRQAADPVGYLNELHVDEAMMYAACTTGWALAAWGNHGTADGLLVRTAAARSVRFMCLGKTLSGAPKHPMARGLHRVPRDTLPTVWP